MCPRCNSNQYQELYSSTDNVDNVTHSHVKCLKCEKQYNIWNCGQEKIKEMFGVSWRLYDNSYKD